MLALIVVYRRKINGHRLPRISPDRWSLKGRARRSLSGINCGCGCGLCGVAVGVIGSAPILARSHHGRRVPRCNQLQLSRSNYPR